MKAYNEKMDSCRALEKMMLSHSEPSLRVELGSLQYRIAQEAANLWVTADMGISAAKKFAQTLEGAAVSRTCRFSRKGLKWQRRRRRRNGFFMPNSSRRQR